MPGSGSVAAASGSAVACDRPVTAAPNWRRHRAARDLTSRLVTSATPDIRLSRTASTATRSPTVLTPKGSSADSARADRPAWASGVDGCAWATLASASSGIVLGTGTNTACQAASMSAAVS